MAKENATAMENFLGLVVGALVSFPLKVFVVMKGWEWLVMPVVGFSFTFWQTFGLLAVWNFLQPFTLPKDDDQPPIAARTIAGIVYSLIALGFFYLYKLIIGY